MYIIIHIRPVLVVERIYCNVLVVFTTGAEVYSHTEYTYTHLVCLKGDNYSKTQNHS